MLLGRQHREAAAAVSLSTYLASLVSRPRISRSLSAAAAAAELWLSI